MILIGPGNEYARGARSDHSKVKMCDRASGVGIGDPIARFVRKNPGGMLRPLRFSTDKPRTSLRDLADEELMQLVRRGDAGAFEVIYDRHAGAAFSLAYRMCGQRTPAEDVVAGRFPRALA